MLYAAPVAGTAGLAALLAWSLNRDPGSLPSALIGKLAPKLNLPPVEGRKLGLSSDNLFGEVSLVNVFASWCVPCRAEHPLLLQIAREKTVPIHGINYKDRPEDASAWLNVLGDPYARTGADRDGRVAIDWGVFGVPETFVIGADGRRPQADRPVDAANADRNVPAAGGAPAQSGEGRRFMKQTLFALAIIGAIGVFAPPAVAEPPQNFVLRETPAPVPELSFTDGEGKPQCLSDFRGKIVLLNIWATWCLPCRREMPTLDRLQAALGGADFEVVALSVDRRGLEVVKKFYAEIGVEHLAIRIDTSSRAGFALATEGLPTSLLVDRQGQEIGRLIGPAEWDAPDMVDFLKSIVAGKQGALAPPRPKERRS